ncbi:hypothetical protein EIP91_003830 [Steccherinum ochraceum]|uniref:Cytochrome P450 n=1 Tax=Steccherinum ochraceum TaxID=92696 RepID=A0A4R0RLE2_9APHY|nr:hypothetical protein EIP91_003830 [Steccherinum ochraceum]
MSTLALGPLEIALLFTCLWLLGHAYHLSRSKCPLPPGPQGWPIIGNILQIPSFFPWLTWRQWTQQYGDIFHYKLLGQSVIVISSPALVSELLNERHHGYDNRPKLTMMCDLVGWDQTTVFMPANQVWREHRKNMSRLFGSKAAVGKFFGIELLGARKLMRRILEEPTGVKAHLQNWAGSLSINISYGYDVKDAHDKYLADANEAVCQFFRLQKPGEFMVDLLPWLKYLPSWLPGAGFQRTAKCYRQTLRRVIDLPFQMVQRQLSAGTAKQCFTSDLLSADDYSQDREYALKTSAATIFAGGADTTAGQLHALLLLMMLYPEIRQKAQAEIDQVVGSERLPDFSDRDRLPYVKACLTEAFRLHTLVPFAGMRVAAEDDVLCGYFVPKGAIIQPNTWLIAHNPEVFPEPFEYVPERYLAEKPPPHPREFSFGYGRRICPGILLADASVWIGATMFLALFDIQPTEGSPTSFDQSPQGVLDGGATCHVKRFACKITPRSAKAEVLIRAIDHEL